MSKYRTPSTSSKYYIPKEDYLTAIHYSRRYPLWTEEAKALADTSAAIRYDKEKVQTTTNYDSTFEAALRLKEINEKIKLVDDTIVMVSGSLAYWLRLGVCHGLSFDQLKGKGMPCEKDKYYLMRRRYYFEISKRI